MCEWNEMSRTYMFYELTWIYTSRIYIIYKGQNLLFLRAEKRTIEKSLLRMVSEFEHPQQYTSMKIQLNMSHWHYFSLLVNIFCYIQIFHILYILFQFAMFFSINLTSAISGLSLVGRQLSPLKCTPKGCCSPRTCLKDKFLKITLHTYNNPRENPAHPGILIRHNIFLKLVCSICITVIGKKVKFYEQAWIILIFNVFWETYVSLLKIFLFLKVLVDYIWHSFYIKVFTFTCSKCGESFSWAHFFEYLYCSTSTKIHVDVVLWALLVLYTSLLCVLISIYVYI